MADKELKFQFKVSEEGEVTVIGRNMFLKEMAEAFSGSLVIGTFRLPKKVRTNAQNRYWWGCFIPELIEGLIETGHDRHTMTPKRADDIICGEILTEEMESPIHPGKFIKITRHTDELDTKEMAQAIKDGQIWAAYWLGINIPDPGEQKEINYL